MAIVQTSYTYTGDGSTTSFAVPFDYLLKTDVLVSVDGDYNLPYVWNGPATIEFTTAPSNGAAVVIARSTHSTAMDYIFQENAPFLPRYIDGDNQQLLYLIQENNYNISRALQLDNEGNFWDAQDKVISNVGDAVEPNDAVNLRTLEGAVEANSEYVLRFPERVNTFVGANVRAGDILAFNNSGQPIAVPLDRAPSTDLAIALASADGAMMIGYDGKTVYESLSTIESKGAYTYNLPSSTPTHIKRDVISSKEVFNFGHGRGRGKGSGNVVQAYALDACNNTQYILFAHGYGSVVCRLNASGYNYQSIRDKTGFSYDLIGHQGLSVEYLKGTSDTRLWTSLSTYTRIKTDGSANYAVSFVYSPTYTSNDKAGSEEGFTHSSPNDGVINTGGIEDYEIWQVFDGYGNGSSTPAISLDGRFLLVIVESAYNRHIRIFSMRDVVRKRAAGDYDLRDVVLGEFKYNALDYDLFDPDAISSSGNPVRIDRQDIACDGNYVYILEGHNTIDPKIASILTFTLDGQLVDIADITSMAEQYIEDGSTLWEPEGLEFVRSPSGGYNLCVMISMGKSGGRYVGVYEIGAKQTHRIVNDDEGVAVSLLMGNSKGIDIAGLNTRGLKLGVVTSGGNPTGYGLGIATGGVCVIGSTKYDYTSPNSFIGSGIGGTHFAGINNGKGAAVTLFRTDDSGTGSRLQLVKSRAGTQTGSKSLKAGDALAYIDFIGDDGEQDWSSSGGVNCARIHARYSGGKYSGTLPTELVFSTRDGTKMASRWVIAAGGNLQPSTDNTYNVGTSAYRPANIYASNGAIQTSDENYKQDIESLSDSELATAKACLKLIRKFRFKESVSSKDASARTHIGIIAQSVVQAFKDNGLDALDYGIVCYDEWEAQDAIYETQDPEIDEEGNVVRTFEPSMVQPAVEAGSRYSIRYDELTMFCLAALAEQLID